MSQKLQESLESVDWRVEVFNKDTKFWERYNDKLLSYGEAINLYWKAWQRYGSKRVKLIHLGRIK